MQQCTMNGIKIVRYDDGRIFINDQEIIDGKYAKAPSHIIRNIIIVLGAFVFGFSSGIFVCF